MNLEVKAATLKALEASGEGAALFSVWSEPDLDGDVTEKGFFGHGVQEVFMLAHHQISSGNPPLAKGVIFEESEGAIYRFKMNLDLPQAQAWHSHFRFDLREGRQPQQQWSYGFRVKEGGSSPRTDGQRGRLLHATKGGQPGAHVLEVSPVTAAAQPLGRTLGAKTRVDPEAHRRLVASMSPRERERHFHYLRREIEVTKALAARQREEQAEAQGIYQRWLARQVAMAAWRS